MKWFIKCIKDYVNFSGRARRKEFWYFVLFSVIFYLVFRCLDWMLFGDGAMRPLSTLFILFIFLPDLAVRVRRLHDTGRSGVRVIWLYLYGFVWTLAVAAGFVLLGAAGGEAMHLSPGMLALLGGGGLVLFVWGIFFIVWFCQSGTAGPNKYGPDPKAE